MWRSRKERRGEDEAAQRVAALERENDRLLASVAGMQLRFRRLARAVWRVEEEERRRIARELHDNLGQVLTALRLRIERLPEGADRDSAVELATQAQEDVRRLSRLMRPPVLDDLGLDAALHWLARQVRENAGLPVRVRGALDTRIDRETETLLFRIAQEALNNTLKHAAATRAELSFSRMGDRFEMHIRDNGRGFDANALDSDKSGIGLVAMRDRAALFGGELIVNSSPGSGTVISVSLTLGQDELTAP
jgi:signal transduction histidine kinase